MKSRCALIAIFLIFDAFHAVHSVDEKAAKDTCIKSLSADDVKLLSDNLTVAKLENVSEELKCYLRCLYKEIGIKSKDGKTDLGTVVSYFEKVTGIKDKMKITATLAECANTKGANDCDTLYQLERCVFQKLGV